VGNMGEKFSISDLELNIGGAKNLDGLVRMAREFGLLF